MSSGNCARGSVPPPTPFTILETLQGIRAETPVRRYAPAREIGRRTRCFIHASRRPEPPPRIWLAKEGAMRDRQQVKSADEPGRYNMAGSCFTTLEAEKLGTYRGDTATRIECAISTTRKALNWRALYQSSDTHETPYDRVKRCRERKINIEASERFSVDGWWDRKHEPDLQEVRHGGSESEPFVRQKCARVFCKLHQLDWEHTLRMAFAIRKRCTAFDSLSTCTEYWGGGNGRSPRKPADQRHRPATIPTCENPVTRPGIKPGSPRWEASGLTARPPRPHLVKLCLHDAEECPERPLVFVRGNMNTEAYCNILDNEMLPTLWRFYGMDPCYFQDDNVRCRVSRATMKWYADNNVRRLDWSAQSTDINPIEHLWDELDRRVRAHQARPKSIAQLMEWLQEEWLRIPMDVLKTFVESMPDRVAADIATRGGPTRF
ncbi:hypothetical protein PR048_026307 [Dryococelus australis]|uniref:Tc1-like transposase DDE domain-containing protein n=1 Tax=Dryococelus australis TaxID=614101 RepID=A0ABQ9GL13_9NEOP|nr:hypothetical protein PR048_026307 [Dryococelus australis]